MAEYKTIKGFKTQSYATDPVAATAAWSSGGDTNTARFSSAQGGTTTAAVLFGGRVPGSTALTETYNGTAWTEVNPLNTARTQICGFGTAETAVMAATGNENTPVVAICEQWNGSTWTEIADLNTGAISRGGAGTTTAGLAVAGVEPTSAPNVAPNWVNTELWNGTSWAETANINTGRKAMCQAGTSTAALMTGGTPPANQLTETWNGTSWSEVNNMNTIKYTGGGAGTSTDALAFGGYNPSPPYALTEKWDGTSWTEVADMATGRGDLPGSGASTSSAAALASAGYTTTWVTTTEEWADYSGTNPAPSVTMLNEGQIWYNTTGFALKFTAIAAGTWASGGTMQRSNGHNNIRGLGTSIAALAVGGSYPSQYGYTEQYDGTSWTVKNPLNTARYAVGCAGTTTAGLAIAGGFESAPYELPNTEEFDGTSWVESGDLTDPRGTGVGCGTQTAALYCGGNYGTLSTPTWQQSVSNEEYNGTSWSEKNNINTGRNYSCQFSAGSTTAAMIAAGNGGLALTETWDGTSWTEVADMNTDRNYGGGFGNSTSAMGFAGENPGGQVTNTEQWDGTSWTEVADVPSPKQGMGGAGLTGTLGAAFGGGPPSSTATSHWDAEAYSVQTVTVS